eukprot:scaffold2552_cov380-Prasinococcus_capsulatus_cf.AAC.10
MVLNHALGASQQEHSQSYDEVADSQDVRNVATATLLRSEHPDGQRLRIIAELTSIEARVESHASSRGCVGALLKTTAIDAVRSQESSENLLDDSCVREQRLSRGLAQAMEDSDAAHVLSCLQRVCSHLLSQPARSLGGRHEPVCTSHSCRAGGGDRRQQCTPFARPTLPLRVRPLALQIFRCTLPCISGLWCAVSESVRECRLAPAPFHRKASLRQKNTLAVGYRTAEGSWILNPLDIHKPLQWSDNIYLAVIEGTSCLNEPTTI